MSDTEPQDGLPSTMPPHPGEEAAQAAVGLVHDKLDRVLAMLEKMYGLQLEEKAAREDLLDRVAALEHIPPPRPTLLPPAGNGHG